jgi:hypothetical protein
MMKGVEESGRGQARPIKATKYRSQGGRTFRVWRYFSNMGYVAWNKRLVLNGELKVTSKNGAMAQCKLLSQYLHQGLGKAIRDVSVDDLFLGWNWKPGPLECEEVSTSRPQRLIARQWLFPFAHSKEQYTQRVKFTGPSLESQQRAVCLSVSSFRFLERPAWYKFFFHGS